MNNHVNRWSWQVLTWKIAMPSSIKDTNEK